MKYNDYLCHYLYIYSKKMISLPSVEIAKHFFKHNI